MSFSLQRFVADCQSVVAQAASAQSPSPVTAISELVRAAISDPAALRTALEGAQGERILHREDNLTVLNVVLPPGFRSVAHDHTMWAIVGIYEGQEDNHFYAQRDGRLEVIQTHAVRAPDLLVLDGVTIHAIANPLDTPTRGLHVYGGDLEASSRSLWDPNTFARERYTRERAMAVSRELARRV